jgi:integrase
MAGRAKSPLDNKAERAKLRPRGAPYYLTLTSTAQLGLRRGKTRCVWVLRRRLEDGSYVVTPIGRADDDLADSLSFDQARDKALEIVMGETPPAKGASQRTKGKAASWCVSDALNAYFEARKSPQKERDLAAAILPTLGRVPLNKLTEEMLSEALLALAERPRKTRGGTTAPAPATDEERRRRRNSANRSWTVLRAALNYAFRKRKVASNAEWKHVKPLANADAARVRWLSHKEARRLVDAIDDESFRNLVVAALHSGARYSELARLIASDYDPRSDTLLVRESKSGESREIALTKEGCSFFERLAAGRNAHDLMLTQADGSPWREGVQARLMRAACKRAGIEAANFHCLRHTAASHMVQDGVPLIMVARNLGHSTTRMCEKHYVHLAPSHVRETIQTKMRPFGFDSDGSNIVTLRR